MDQVTIRTQFNWSSKSFKLRIIPKFKTQLSLTFFLLGMPELIKNLIGNYEKNARQLVDSGMIGKDEMRLILSIAIKCSIGELGQYLQLVDGCIDENESKKEEE